ncbi:DNA polymerase Y family protein [Pseudovibrio sp. FO-BEG1]|uniref:DNA polymerase Y family protein n=1 Tax=Pseudovibrio sp. (strain FO-BEG1) TaxID=911045 RepID=UPI001FCA5D0E|nr:DNA polymerase Y family protein [Pseudovibrio sp. FO-BEG1]
MLCLWFAELATDRVCRRELGKSWLCEHTVKPIIVYRKVKNAYRLSCVNGAAKEEGLSPGEALSDARARVPDVQSEEDIPEANESLLAALADWCDRYTPLVAVVGDDTLLLDISGCAHLFGGEKAMLDDCLNRLKLQGFHVSGAVADTVGAAWAIARSDGGVIAPREQRDALEPLSIELLRVEENIVTSLMRVGLTEIGDLLDRPRAPLANRFGEDLVRRLDQALGMEGEPISPRLYTPALVVERRFFEPIAREDDVAAVIQSLSENLQKELEKRQEGGRAFELVLFRVDGVVNRLAVGTSGPIRAPNLVLQLFRERLKTVGDELDAGFGYDLIRLAVLEAQCCSAAQLNLEGNSHHEDDLAELVDRLGARLGLAQVSRFLPCDEHLPEVQSALVPAATVRENALYWADVDGDREEEAPLEHPLRMLPRGEPVEAVAMVPEGPPLRFRWRKASYEISSSEGPQRIAPPWWRSAAGVRDYYRVEDREGRRFWLYREGLYGGQNEVPRWYLQGLYA